MFICGYGIISSFSYISSKINIRNYRNDKHISLQRIKKANANSMHRKGIITKLILLRAGRVLCSFVTDGLFCSTWCYFY